MYTEEQVRFSGTPPARYASSPEATRSFCARCGTPLSFVACYIPGLIDLTVGSFDQPETLAPHLHYWESRRLPWVLWSDGLPRHAEFPPQEEP
jgi:hypothetical protein